MKVLQGFSTFSIHVKPEDTDPVASLEVIPEGFSWWGFVFAGIWLLYQRLWLALAVFITVMIFLISAETQGIINAAESLMLQLVLQFAIGMFGHDLRRVDLAGKGYVTTDVVVAGDELAAAQRYLDRVTFTAPTASGAA